MFPPWGRKLAVLMTRWGLVLFSRMENVQNIISRKDYIQGHLSISVFRYVATLIRVLWLSVPPMGQKCDDVQRLAEDQYFSKNRKCPKCHLDEWLCIFESQHKSKKISFKWMIISRAIRLVYYNYWSSAI